MGNAKAERLSSEDRWRLLYLSERHAHLTAEVSLAAMRANHAADELHAAQQRVREAYGTREGDEIDMDSGCITRRAPLERPPPTPMPSDGAP